VSKTEPTFGGLQCPSDLKISSRKRQPSAERTLVAVKDLHLLVRAPGWSTDFLADGAPLSFLSLFVFFCFFVWVFTYTAHPNEIIVHEKRANTRERAKTLVSVVSGHAKSQPSLIHQAVPLVVSSGLSSELVDPSLADLGFPLKAANRARQSSNRPFPGLDLVRTEFHHRGTHKLIEQTIDLLDRGSCLASDRLGDESLIETDVLDWTNYTTQIF
jgi:hypothetical protein